ncbi:glycosyltransferase WbuB, partial [bacterium]|nr:glycosyltransferase WbuB [bacterium]
MHLLVVTQYFWPENFRINDLVSDLLKRGHQVTVLTGYPNYPEGKILPVFKADKERFSRFEGAQIIRCPLIPRGRNKITLLLNYLSFALSACLLGMWKLRNIKVDMIFVYQLSPATVGLPGILFKKFKKVPMVLWVLDLW